MTYRPLLLGLLVSLSATAQTFSVQNPSVDRGLTLPPTGVALSDDATASSINPAGLSSVRDVQFFWLHERNFLKDGVNDGIFVSDTFFDAFSVGYQHQWLRDSGGPRYRKFAWAFALGNPLFSIGTTANFFRSEQDADLNDLKSWDIGLMSRPHRMLSIGAVVRNVDQPTQGALTLARHYDLGLGLRPVGDRLTLGVDLLFGEVGGLGAGRMSYAVNAEILRGLLINAGISHGFNVPAVTFQLGLTVNLPTVGVGYAMGAAPGGTSHTTALRISREKYRALPVREGQIAFLDLPARLSPSQNPTAMLLGVQEDDPFVKVMEWLDAAAQDVRLEGVAVKIDSLPLGLAKAEELRQAFLRLRANGKRVVAIIFSAEDPEYLVASAADKIYAVPEAMIAVDGFAANVTFLGGAMQKLGVDFDVARVGAYKNAPDMFTRTGMSPEQRETLDAYLDSAVRQYQVAGKQGRNFSTDKLTSVFAEGLFPPKRAKAVGLIDDVLVPEELDDALRAYFPGARMSWAYDPFEVKNDRWGMRKRIAIIPVIGDIAGGKSRRDPFGLAEIAGSETVVQALDRASRDPGVGAIVLRIDSRGGSGQASDLMYRAVLEAKKKKPVVASMGDAAASGGYYAAMGADEIWATPNTLTGSIGVFILKPAAEKLATKLGIHREVIQRGPLSNLFDPVKPWGVPERAAAQKWVDSFYDDFITEVAMNRKTTKQAIDQVARGRVWSGDDAKSRGLVDQQGGLVEAVASARKRAGISENEKVEWEIFGNPKGPLAEVGANPGLLNHLTAGISPPTPGFPEEWKRAALELGFDPLLIAEPGMKAMLPFSVRVR